MKRKGDDVFVKFDIEYIHHNDRVSYLSSMIVPDTNGMISESV